ncbi:hypothetical protein DPMN_143797 [Dreissena polymorpha]|uniref:C-type lectin domain-containing protein n=1 Tax=Dreissena polymorpha TaxID=45954 RepID=A0A9D4GDS7_DREPO|nr:hypothetical protein DPMN_143797 [Dreissena polymorpha]
MERLFDTMESYLNKLTSYQPKIIVRGGAVCPDGYCRHSGGCYRTVALNVTWIDARSYCGVLGGALLSSVSQSMAAAAEGALRRTRGTIFPGKF